MKNSYSAFESAKFSFKKIIYIFIFIIITFYTLYLGYIGFSRLITYIMERGKTFKVLTEDEFKRLGEKDKAAVKIIRRHPLIPYFNNSTTLYKLEISVPIKS